MRTFDAKDTIGGVSIGDTPTTIPLDTLNINTTIYASHIFTLDSGELTWVVYEETPQIILCNVTLEAVSGNQITVVAVWLEKNGTEITGTRRLVPLVAALAGSSCSINAVEQFNGGDVIRIRAQKIRGNNDVQTIADGTTLVMFI
jgi:hypothetical protein